MSEINMIEKVSHVKKCVNLTIKTSITLNLIRKICETLHFLEGDIDLNVLGHMISLV